MTENNHTPPPQIPGEVYSSPPIAIECAGIFACFGMFIWLQEISIETKTVLLVCLGGLVISAYKYMPRANKVYLDKTTLIKNFGLRSQKSESLENYCIRISRYNIRSTLGNHYSYTVHLLAKSVTTHRLESGNILPTKIYIDIKKLISPSGREKKTKIETHASSKVNMIPLCTRIFTPKNLREFVEAIQAQTATTMPVIFDSEQTRADYESGQYRSKVA